MLKVGFISLGCAKNQVDLERLAGTLNMSGFVFTDSPSECDIMVINTCGFIKPAVEEAIDNILSIKGELPEHAKLVVFGCMVERYKNEIAAELEEIDFFAGVDAQKELLEYISQVAGQKIEEKTGRYIFNTPYFAYLKIAEGCNNRCTYCTIPSIRGNMRSFPPDQLLEEANTLISSGVKEIIVISQDSTKYGSDLNDYTLSKLLRELAEKYPETYFRIMYLNPDGVTEELIRTVAAYDNIFNYFEIPVQHISDKILKSMNRHSDKKQIQKIYGMIRSIIPDAFIRTTFIIGFPGETESDFNELLEFVEKYKPDFAGFFPYSAEEDTPAALYAEKVPDKTVSERMKKAQKIQRKNTLKRLDSLKSDDILCFIDGTNADFDFILEGRAFFQAPEVDGKLYITDTGGLSVNNYGPYLAKIHKNAYPDVFASLKTVNEE